MAEVIVIDTCILISNPLRTMLLDLGQRGMLAPAWSAVIGDEWRRNAGRLWSIGSEDMQAHWSMLQDQFPEADQGDVNAWKAGLAHCDPKDWHVVAAARAAVHGAARAAVLAQGGDDAASAPTEVTIVTRNLKDFNRRELRRWGIGLSDPDSLLVRYWQRDREVMNALLRSLPERVRGPDKPLLALEDLLKRERLFRLNRLYMSQCP
ncbi:MAG: PIN domain-containing protein [Candidimonas sp.]